MKSARRYLIVDLMRDLAKGRIARGSIASLAFKVSAIVFVFIQAVIAATAAEDSSRTAIAQRGKDMSVQALPSISAP